MAHVHGGLCSLSLPDGRRLSYVEQGDTAGTPVLLFHGAPGLMRMRDADAAVARDASVHLVTVHRPGYGGSDPLPGRRIADWPSDVAAVADALGASQFAVIGWSNGGAHALACGWALADRVTSVGIVAGFAPHDGRGWAAGFSGELKMLYGVGRRAPWALRPALWGWSQGVVRWADRLYDRMNADACATQAAVAVEQAFRAQLVGDFVATAQRKGVGLAGDVNAHTRPWGFELADVAVPVRLWHGERDSLVPVSHGRRLAAGLPQCAAAFLPEEGHEVLFTHLDEILSAVTS